MKGAPAQFAYKLATRQCVVGFYHTRAFSLENYVYHLGEIGAIVLTHFHVHATSPSSVLQTQEKASREQELCLIFACRNGGGGAQGYTHAHILPSLCVCAFSLVCVCVCAFLPSNGVCAFSLGQRCVCVCAFSLGQRCVCFSLVCVCVCFSPGQRRVCFILLPGNSQKNICFINAPLLFIYLHSILSKTSKELGQRGIEPLGDDCYIDRIHECKNNWIS